MPGLKCQPTAAAQVDDTGSEQSTITVASLFEDMNLLGESGESEPFNSQIALARHPSAAAPHKSTFVLENPVDSSGVYSLCEIRETSPQEKLQSTLAAKKYSEALELTRFYNLDPDQVRQQQWLDSPVTPENNSDYLTKVKDIG